MVQSLMGEVAEKRLIIKAIGNPTQKMCISTAGITALAEKVYGRENLTGKTNIYINM